VIPENKINFSSELIVQLARNAFDNAPELAHWKKQLINEGQFRDEFQTVKITLPRQAGHTIAALQLMYEYPGSLLFVPNGSARLDAIAQIKHLSENREIIKEVENNTLVPSHSGLIQIKARLARPFVIFDQSSAMSSNTKLMIKDTFNAQVFLELQ
jgi:hypothetical protein